MGSTNIVQTSCVWCGAAADTFDRARYEFLQVWNATHLANVGLMLVHCL